VFCDIDAETFCITADSVKRVLTESTKAIVPVHLFGTPAPMDELRSLAARHGVKLVEDAAQAAGATLRGKRAGSLGDAATFSFFPSKNLFCLGDGGAIATDDEDVADKARLLRLHGSRAKQTYLEIGYNSRLDALQAAVLRVLLTRLDSSNANRRALAAEYERAGLAEIVALPQAPLGAEPVHHMYVVRSDRRDTLLEALEGAGIEGRVSYAVPVHRQPAMAKYAAGVDLPETERAAATNMAIPMGPTRSADTAAAAVEALRQAVNSR
jgi:dTDP-4-amino-4,6-dideoxygalactose transaminase